MWRVWMKQAAVSIGGFEIIDEYGSVTLSAWVFGGLILIVIAAGVYFLGKEYLLTQAGKNSPEKQRIAQIISEVTNGDASLETAYAFWSVSRTQGNQKLTKYWYYAIGFNKERLCVVPISITDSKPHQISYSNYYILEPDQLSLVNDGGNWVELYDKEGTKIFSLMMEYAVTDSALSDHKLNINQEETYSKWVKEFIPYWVDKVNTANGTKATGYINNADKFDFRGQRVDMDGNSIAKNK